VLVIDDDTWQPDEMFTVELSDVQVVGQASPGRAGVSYIEPRLGLAVTKITVLNDDMPGTISFDVDEVFAVEGMHVTVGILRSRGNVGRITCKYKTMDLTAIGGRDYSPMEGTIEFGDGEVHKTIEIPILKTHHRITEAEERFKVILCDASPGVKFDKERDGGESCNISEVIIPPTRKPGVVAKVMRQFCNEDQLAEHWRQWGDQCISSLYCNGSAQEQVSASLQDWFFHILTLTFKVPFSLIPPPTMMGGWACFVGALAMIGLVTSIVGGLATLVGCCLGIPDDITAITLVALGTSLPDTFASKLAAQQDETADNSIGNVTGSNSVNVFLGLGLPWTIAAFYWSETGPNQLWMDRTFGSERYEDLYLAKYPGGGFMVPAGSLAISVAVFTMCAISCLTLLGIRRCTYGGELGGPKWAQHRDSVILVGLWFVYVATSIVVSMSQ